MLEKTQLHPKVDRCYPFTKVNDELAHVAGGHLQGKTSPHIGELQLEPFVYCRSTVAKDQLGRFQD